MKPHSPHRQRRFLLAFLITAFAVAVIASFAVRAARNERRSVDSSRRAALSRKGHLERSPVSTGPHIYLDESRELPAAYVGDTSSRESLDAGKASPLSMTSGDF